MRILLSSHWFAPSVGGVETVSQLLAEEFTKAGAQVTVITTTPGPSSEFPYEVVRQPSLGALRKLASRSDVILQNLISLRTLLPVLDLRKPIVVTHASWMRRPDGTRGWENYIQLLAVRACHNVAISRAIAQALPVPSVTIGNPFDAVEFDGLRDQQRDKDIVFLGRLVSDKGCDVLIRAMAELKQMGLCPSLTIIGDGPERKKLESMTGEFGLGEQIEFAGALRKGRGEVVARHRIMAIPSLWAEPFGVVALEGVASGCAVVASSGGGLPDAVGPCGLLFPNGDAVALAGALKRVLSDASLREDLTSKGPEHLKAFQPAVVAQEYMKLFTNLVS